MAYPAAVQKVAQTVGVIEEESVEGPVRARPLGPSEINDEEAEVYPVGRATGTAMRVKTLLVRVARAVLSERKKRRVNFESRRADLQSHASFSIHTGNRESRESPANLSS